MSVRTRLMVLQAGFLLAICLFLFFFGLGAFGLVGADEPRYAQIAREMLARRDWILPTLNGAPWLEKPALLYWQIMNGYALLGAHDWVARVPSALQATAFALAAFFFMRRFRPGSELDAAIMTASCAAIVGFARGASTDMPLTACFGGALLAWWAWHRTNRKLWLGTFYALLGCATLAKGPVAPALAVLVVGAYAGLRRDGKTFIRSLEWPGVALFFVIVLPWYIAVEQKAPRFFHVFFLEHNLARFGTNMFQHAQPFWYYIPVFLLSTLPWTVLALPALADAGNGCRRRLRARGPDPAEPAVSSGPDPADGDDLPIFLFLWTVIPVLFFSLSRSKLPGYILPAIPPAALLTAERVHRKKIVGRLALMLHSLLCGAMIGGALLLPWFMMKTAVPGPTRAIVAVTTGAIAILVLVVVRRGGLPALHFATLIPLVLGTVFLLRMAAIPESDSYPVHGLILDITQSTRAVNLQLQRFGVSDDAPVAVFNVRRDVAYGLNFYRKRPISYYESGGPRDLPSGIPEGEHVVVAGAGSENAVKALVAPRPVRRLGAFPPQHLEFFAVSNPE